MIYSLFHNKDEWKIIPCTIPSGKTDTVSGNKNETTSAGPVVNRPDNNDTLVKDESGSWWHMKNGKVDYTETLCKYNGTWWYIKNGRIDFSSTTLCKYSNNWYAVTNGKVAWGYSGKLECNGRKYNIKNGIVRF